MYRIKSYLSCLFGRHDYTLIQSFDYSARRVGCPGCRKTWIVNSEQKTRELWSRKWEDLYIELGYTIREPNYTVQHTGLLRKNRQ